MSLTIEELKDKIQQVKKDINAVMETGESGRKIEVLHEYLEYLNDELKMKLDKNLNKNVS